MATILPCRLLPQYTRLFAISAQMSHTFNDAKTLTDVAALSREASRS
jgi:hypothetical protein